MNTKAVVILAAATTLLIALVALLGPGPSGPSVPDNAGALFPSLAERAGDLTTIEITTGTGALTIARQGSAWVLPAKDNHPANIDEVRRLVTQIQTLEPTDRKTADPANHARLGLALPGAGNDTESTRVRLLTTEGDPLADLLLGITTEGNQFIRRADADQTWLIDTTVPADAEPTRWFDTRPVRVERDEVRRVTIEHPDSETVTVIKADDDFTLEPIPEGRELVGPWAAGQIAGALGFVNVTDVAAGDWMQDAEVTTITYELEPTEGEGEPTLTVRIAERDSQPWASFLAAGPGAEEVNAIVQGWSYQISPFTRDTLTKRLEDLLKPLPDPPAPATGDGADPAIPPALTPPTDAP